MGKKINPFSYPKGSIPDYYPVNNSIVVFFDVVGFTKDTTNAEMKKIIQKINNIIEDVLWDDYDWNEKSKPNDLILVPTGDGYGVAFHPSISGERVLQVAIDLYRGIIRENGIKIRMGIAKGPNIRHKDMNDKVNVFGYGINLASRVMTSALDNQILVHEDVANDINRTKKCDELKQIDKEIDIKHGETIKVFNYYKEGDFGNPENP